jgi:hypothetical protein
MTRYAVAVALDGHRLLSRVGLAPHDAVKVRRQWREAFRFAGAEVTVAMGAAVVTERFSGVAWMRRGE